MIVTYVDWDLISVAPVIIVVLIIIWVFGFFSRFYTKDDNNANYEV